MIIIKCTYADGDEVLTRFNGTLQEAKTYFLNKVFNIGADRDNLQKCVKVEEYCDDHAGCNAQDVANC